jgi:sec-independent protein translocase protein TatA
MATLALLPGGTELWIILAVVLLLFGSRKLPELARSMGSSITQFKKGLKDSDGAKLPPAQAKTSDEEAH